jgi:hypothetical protein
MNSATLVWEFSFVKRDHIQNLVVYISRLKPMDPIEDREPAITYWYRHTALRSQFELRTTKELRDISHVEYAQH